MKLMCKPIALLVSVCLVAAFLPAKARGEQQEENPMVQKLAALGILDSTDELPQGDITRGEFAAWLARLLNVQGISEGVQGTIYADVPEGHKQYVSIMYLRKLKIISEASEFYPDNEIAYDEAVKMLVSALGYDVYARASGGFPTGYLMTAESYRIIPQSAVRNYGGTVTYAQAAEIFDFAVDAPILRQGQYGERETYASRENVTALSEYHNIYKVKGVLSAVGSRRLFPGKHIGADMIEISEESYINMAGVGYQTLGCPVTGYYKDLADSDPVMIYLQKDLVRNGELIIEGDRINGFQSGEISYYSASGARTSNVKIPAAAHVMYNYNYTSKYTQDDILKADRVVLIDSDKDGEYDSVSIIREKTVFVSGVSFEDRKIYGKNKEIIDLFITDSRQTIAIYDSEGYAADLQDIAEYAVLSVIADKENISVDIFICYDTVTGKVEEADTAKSPTDRRYTVDGKTYKLANNAEAISNLDIITVGQNVTLYLNRYGDVAGVEARAEGGYMRFGYLADVDTAVSLVDKARFFIYTQDGELKEFSAADKFILDSQVVRDMGDVLRIITQDGNISVRQLVRYRLDDKGYIKEIDLAEQVIAADLLTERADLTRYDNFADPKNNAALKPASYNKEYRAFLGELRVSPDTLIMFVPRSASFYKDAEKYAIKKVSDLRTMDYYYVETYNVSPDRTAGAIVVHADDTGGVPIQKNTVITAISKISEVSDKNGNKRTKIYGLEGTKEVEYMLAEGCSLTQNYLGANGALVPSTIECGDLIRIGKNDKGEVYYYYKVFSFKNRDNVKFIRRGNEAVNPDETYLNKGSKATMIQYSGNADSANDIMISRVWQGDNASWFTGTPYSVEFGIVKERYGSAMMVNNIGGALTSEDLAENTKTKGAITQRFINMKNRPIYVIEEGDSGVKVRIGSYDDVIAIDSVANESEASRVVYARYGEVPSFMAVIKRK